MFESSPTPNSYELILAKWKLKKVDLMLPTQSTIIQIVLFSGMIERQRFSPFGTEKDSYRRVSKIDEKVKK
jgi:hypothetical protein